MNPDAQINTAVQDGVEGQEIIVELDFSHIILTDTLLISEIRTGYNVDLESFEALKNLADSHFTRPFIYISHRINPFSVDPMIYRKLATVNNMRGLAIVAYQPIQRNASKIEEYLIARNIAAGIFSTMDEAMIWAREILSQG